MSTDADARLVRLAELGDVLAGACGLEAVVDAALDSLGDQLGFAHVLVMINQPETDRLTTIASRGYDVIGIGSEVRIGEGVIGKVAETRRPMRVANLQRMITYLRRASDSMSADDPSVTVELPGLAGVRSQLAAPMVADGALIGVITVESERALAFDETDQLVLSIAAHLIGGALERAEVVDRGLDGAEEPLASDHASGAVPRSSTRHGRVSATLRHYVTDGSTFIDDEYVIKGVAGRLLWKLASEHTSTGRTAYSNREVRLDPTLDMPSFRDNFESRLVLLKRRLEERDAPLRIMRAGRGRFEVDCAVTLHLERIEPAES